MFSKKNLTPQEEGLSIIAGETFLEGNIRTRGSLRVDGKIEGHITGARHVVVGEKGEIKGSLDAESVIVGGKIFGNVKTKNSLRILAQGHLRGDIRTPSLHIEEGAAFEGTCAMVNLSSTAAPSNDGVSFKNDLFEPNRVLTPLLK